jgi:hypothetical protein
MQELFLTEVLTAVITPAAYTRTSDVQIIAQNNIILYSPTFINFQVGAVISINTGPQYPIQSCIFDSLTQTYRVQVLGGIQPLSRQSLTWSIFNVTSTASVTNLDIENIDITTDFAVSDLADIANRKDSITKTIQLKGTETNSRAFGHLFFLGRHVSFTIANKLFFNYTPIRTVDCLLYEDGIPILRGQLFITEIKTDRNGGIIYNANIIGSFINFKTILGDRQMTDLDLRDMEHTYSALAVLDSWGGNTGTIDAVGNSRTYWTNQVTGVPYTKPFEFGLGYVYASIDYGEKFKLVSANKTYDTFKLQNYRPAVYTREYFNRIITGAGFTYELLGSPDFIARFNKMITPDSREKMEWLQLGTAGTFSTGAVTLMFQTGTDPTQVYNWTTYDNDDPNDPNAGLYSLAVPVINLTNTNEFERDGQFYPKSFLGSPVPDAQRDKLFIRAKKDIRIAARVRATGHILLHSTTYSEMTYYVQLVRRARPEGDYAETDIGGPGFGSPGVITFEVLAEQGFTVQNNVDTPYSVDFKTQPVQFNQGDQLHIRIVTLSFVNSANVYITTMNLDLPATVGDLYNVEVQVGNKTVPQAPEGMTQFEYVKSVINSLNLYVFTNKDQPRHLIMQTYDDYYALTSPSIIKTTALDWTNKIDLSKGFTIKSNLSQPKKYLFTFAEDSDYLNALYKSRTGRVYGDFKFSDSLGFTDQKPVQLSFAATPPAQIPGREKRFIPIITSGGISLDKKERMKTKPRLLYFSGVYYDKDAPGVYEDFWNTAGGVVSNPGVWETDFIFSVPWYALCGNYLFSDSNDIYHPATSKTTDLIPIYDIHFAPPLVYFFTTNVGYTSVPTHYAYYRQQTTELTNPNLHTIILGVHLNEIDINNLSLKTPVLVNLGEHGYAYYKVILLSYTNANKITNVTLQKIPN